MYYPPTRLETLMTGTSRENICEIRLCHFSEALFHRKKKKKASGKIEKTEIHHGSVGGNLVGREEERR